MRRLLGTALRLSIANIASVSISVWAADASPASATGNLPPLLENIGHAEWVIDTRSGLAQQYFNQGVRLLYGFNFEQAIDAFRAANVHDGGGCAICCWGESYAVGKLSRVAQVTYYTLQMAHRSWRCRSQSQRGDGAGPYSYSEWYGIRTRCTSGTSSAEPVWDRPFHQSISRTGLLAHP